MLSIALISLASAANADGLSGAHTIGSIRVMQWNPHWQCFGNDACAGNATDQLNLQLTNSDRGLDFANVIELETTSYTAPAGWAMVGDYNSCGGKYGDWDTLFYDARKWKLVANETGCMYSARSYSIGTFSLVTDPSLVITTVGAHYPQTLNASTDAYADATSNLSATIRAHIGAHVRVPVPAAKIVLMADTNTEGPEAAAATAGHAGVNRTNGELAADLGFWAASNPVAPPSAKLFKGCCAGDSPPFAWQGDRIIANFGKNPVSTVLFDPAPAWVADEFHKGVILELPF